MCFLKYFASLSVWLANKRRSSTGISGIYILTFSFLQQKVGPSPGNLIAWQNWQLFAFFRTRCFFGRSIIRIRISVPNISIHSILVLEICVYSEIRDHLFINKHILILFISFGLVTNPGDEIHVLHRPLYQQARNPLGLVDLNHFL